MYSNLATDLAVVFLTALSLTPLALVRGRSLSRSAPIFTFAPHYPTTIYLTLQKILALPIHADCELLYVHSSPEPDQGYSYDSFGLNQASAGQRTLSLYTANLTYPRHEDIHRHVIRHCAVGILFFTDFSSPEQLQSWLFSTITPRYGPVLRKDVDHFIFVAPSQSVADAALLSPKFGGKIKYKMALFPVAPENKDVSCETVDFYAGPGGEPLLKNLETFQSEGDEEETLEGGSSLDLFPDMTRDFNGHTFRYAVPNVNWRFEIYWRDGSYHPKRGFYKWWLNEALRKFNFTYFMFPASYGRGSGKPLQNGTWVGAAGDILYERADITVIVGETYSRHHFFGFSAVLSYEWVVFSTHKPWATYSPKAIFWPFSPLMWTLFILSLFAMTFSLKMVSRCSADPQSSSTKWSTVGTFGYFFTTFLEQDRIGPLKTHSIRMLTAFWLLFALITSTAYRGKLVALIAFPIYSWVPTTFKELAFSNFKVALNTVGQVGAAYDMFSSSTDPAFQTLFQKMELIQESEVCLYQAMTEDKACIIWQGIIQYASARNLSDKFGYVPIVESKGLALFINDGFTYERRAIFISHMDRTINAAFQMGLPFKWLEFDKAFIWKERKQWERESNQTAVHFERYEGPQKLVVSQFTGLLLLSVAGISLASAQFIAELWQHGRRDGQPKGMGRLTRKLYDVIKLYCRAIYNLTR